MAVLDREIDTEAIPRISVPVSDVPVETPPEVLREAHVVELVAAVQGVDAVPPTDVVPDGALVLRERVPRNVLEELRYQVTLRREKAPTALATACMTAVQASRTRGAKPPT
jgi:hypothetical protein